MRGESTVMKKKKTTLPSNFQELLAKSDIDSLKQVFESCEIDAVYSEYYGGNAFAMTPLLKEFAVWLKEQGADIEMRNRYGQTPLFKHASAYNGNVDLLIALGADVNATSADGSTPLHHAASCVRLAAVNALISHGADVNAKSRDESLTPLEMMLVKANGPAYLPPICETLLEHGAVITERSKEAVARLGRDFEFAWQSNKENTFMKELKADALPRLYAMFDVTPVAEMPMHDGVSPIIIEETSFQEQYNHMWNYLVPSSGRAATAQGEVIRIAGKVSYEIMDNGGINWDRDFKKLLKVLPKYFETGNSLPKTDLSEVNRLIKAISTGNGSDEPKHLTEYAVKWVLQNQTVIAPLPSFHYGKCR